MEDTEEIATERRREHMTQRRHSPEVETVRDTQAGSVNEEGESEAAARREQLETEKWQQASKFTAALNKNKGQEDGQVRACYKRLGPVIFDVTGEFVEWIERRLIWTNRELEKGQKVWIRKSQGN